MSRKYREHAKYLDMQESTNVLRDPKLVVMHGNRLVLNRAKLDESESRMLKLCWSVICRANMY